ncbi:hypothetical protein [Dethiobacter alkaliphilus]|uniref:hypothetical protein n=1 Tax=Dethiobacter alkaliphilus TaxID=427926 RepID=UPI002226B6CF|nr:hypothetical protein [Dethiobacter alkaliphilus]MCW3489432.1 hypothetical protein [Dethiobacter alkaliphilus]
MIKFKQVTTVLLIALLMLAVLPTQVHAHRMLIEQDGEMLLVRYDDNTIASRATLRLYQDNEMVWEGNVDENGRVRPPVPFSRAVADDGLGHRATYIPGEVQRDLPRPLAAAVGVSFFMFVASLGHFFNVKKNKTKEG